MSERSTGESFEEFKNSFAYGTRTDLNFKFLGHLSQENAAGFIQELFLRLGTVLDEGDVKPVLQHIIETQIRAYSAVGKWTYKDGFFTQLKKPLSETRFTLLTSSGHFVAGEDPQPFGVPHMTQKEAIIRIDDFLRVEPTLSIIPVSTNTENLKVRHGGYDVSGVLRDHNVAFPLEILKECVNEGIIGELAPDVYSFMGACAQLPLLKKSGSQWVRRLQEQKVEAVLLVPV